MAEKLRMSLEQVGRAEAAVRDLQVALGYANFTQKNHEDDRFLINYLCSKKGSSRTFTS